MRVGRMRVVWMMIMRVVWVVWMVAVWSVRMVRVVRVMAMRAVGVMRVVWVVRMWGVPVVWHMPMVRVAVLTRSMAVRGVAVCACLERPYPCHAATHPLLAAAAAALPAQLAPGEVLAKTELRNISARCDLQLARLCLRSVGFPQLRNHVRGLVDACIR